MRSGIFAALVRSWFLVIYRHLAHLTLMVSLKLLIHFELDGCLRGNGSLFTTGYFLFPGSLWLDGCLQGSGSLI